MTTRGTISLTFDDGYESVYQNVVPLLNKYQLPGVFALTIDHQRLQQSVSRPIRPWQNWLSIKDRGHEIASHTVNHPNLTELSPAKLDQELQQSQQTLNASTLVYPGGAVNDTVAEKAQQYYSAARTVKRGFETLPSKDRMQLHSYNWTQNNFSVPKANLLALWAYLTNSWLIETYHIVDDRETERIHAVSLSDLDKHVRFVSQLPIHVKTIADICA